MLPNPSAQTSQEHMLIVSERSQKAKKVQHPDTRNSLPQGSKYPNNYDYKEYKVHEPESSSQMIEG